jgi:hypothetical protein
MAKLLNRKDVETFKAAVRASNYGLPAARADRPNGVFSKTFLGGQIDLDYRLKDGGENLPSQNNFAVVLDPKDKPGKTEKDLESRLRPLCTLITTLTLN